MYPYFLSPLIKALKGTPLSGNVPLASQFPEIASLDRQALKSRLAVNICDTSTLRDIIGLDSESLSQFYPADSLPNPDTNATIETFLQHFAPDDTQSSGSPLLDELDNLPLSEQSLPADVNPDIPARVDSAISHTGLGNVNSYVPTHDENANPHSGLDKTVSSESPQIAEPIHSAFEDTSAPLTESFARILIKNGNYAKAIDIITTLNLNNNQKSIYFADQIRFLRKLMANQAKS